MYKGNEFWNGSNGMVWVNDTLWDSVSSFEGKVEWEYEEIPVGMETARLLVGYSVSGTIKLRKKDSKAMILVANEYKKGIIPDVKIVGKAMNQSTGAVERVSYSGVTFDETTLSNFEEKKVMEIEVPFKAQKFDILQTA